MFSFIKHGYVYFVISHSKAKTVCTKLPRACLRDVRALGLECDGGDCDLILCL